ncbi:MAG: GNAT family N-acetyltransferase [Myxococcales bacterium]|nr:GNAT family N-acetyltransferase [Myxococcales bacterium]
MDPRDEAPDRDRLPTLLGERVALRWLEARDVDGLFTLFGDPKVTEYWSWPAYTARDQAARLLESIHAHFREGSLYQWGVVLRGEDRVIGTCTLASIDRTHLRAEVGFALASARWGRGLMGEALAVLIDHAFGPLGLRRLEADVDPRNHRSLALLERHGFRREGYLRERWRVGGEVQDSALLGLLARERPRPSDGRRTTPTSTP